MHHLAGGAGDIFAQPERLRIGVGQLPALHVGQHMADAGHQALAFGLDCFFERDRIGERRIGGAHSLDHGAHGKFKLRFVRFRQMLHFVRRADHIVRHQLIALPHQVENRMFPLRRCKAAILRIDLGMTGFCKRSEHFTPGIERMFIGAQRVRRTRTETFCHFCKLFGVHNGRDVG